MQAPCADNKAATQRRGFVVEYPEDSPFFRDVGLGRIWRRSPSQIPVENGLVASLARPGGNLTGFAQETGEEVTKRLQLLREVVPKLTRVATLSGIGMSYNPYFVTTLQDAARGIGISVLPFEIRNVEDVNQAFVDIERARADGLIVFGGPVTLEHRSAIIGLAAKKQVPAVWSDRERVVDGGLMSYGAAVADLYRRAAGYVDRMP